MSITGHNLRPISLDRIDSDLGYTIDNVQLVCKWINLAKNTASNEQILVALREFKEL